MFQRVHLAKKDLPGCQQIFKNMFMITRFNLIRNEKGGGLHVANSLKISHYLLFKIKIRFNLNRVMWMRLWRQVGIKCICREANMGLRNLSNA